MISDAFHRTALLLGAETMARIARAQVAVFGLGGVGGWCAEALVRSGITNLLLVDYDTIAVSNINRQLIATTETVGQIKVDAVAARLRAINPAVQLTCRAAAYTADTAHTFPLADYDFVIDAIDSVPDKAALILHALSIPSVTLFSSMGAALKLDPLQIKTSAFKKVEGDGLARALRQRFKKTATFPARAFTCVWSPEHQPKTNPDPVNGSYAPVTAAFGLALAGLVIRALRARTD